MPAGNVSETDQEFRNLAGPIVDAGIAPAEVAAMIVAAIRKNEFWILTHPEWKNVIRERAAGMFNNELVTGFGG
jgi:hypothetical protein